MCTKISDAIEVVNRTFSENQQDAIWDRPPMKQPPMKGDPVSRRLLSPPPLLVSTYPRRRLTLPLTDAFPANAFSYK